MSQHNFPIERDAVQTFLPHRDPMLFIDRVISADKTSIHAQTRVDPDWPVFKGHFPDRPLMPAVLMMEMTAQAGALIVILEEGATDNSVIAFCGVDKARFRKPVVPGDQLDIHAEITHERRGYYKMKGHILVDGKKAVELEFVATHMSI